jgi:hypothetical protein
MAASKDWEKAYHTELDRAALEGWKQAAHEFGPLYLYYRRANPGETVGELRFFGEDGPPALFPGEVGVFELADPEPWPLRMLERGQIYNRLRNACGMLPLIGTECAV